MPLLQAYYIPFTPTRAYPSMFVPRLPVASPALNRLSYHVARQVMWQSLRRADSRAGRVFARRARGLRGPLSP